MNVNILEFLVYPKCKSSLLLEKEVIENNKIKTGVLKCDKCNKEYPIINFIPRFVSSELYVSSFGDEWNIYKNVKNSKSQMSKDEMKNYLGLNCSDVEDKFVLEVGCGAGPYLDISAREFKTKHIIGIDLSRAVDTVYENVGDLENVNIIQVDLFNLPFKENSFDLVFSLGVLHHTPNTKEAFKSISKYVKSSGLLSIWFYGAYWTRKTKNLEWLRKNIFFHFSPVQMKLFSKFAAYFLYYLYLIPIIGDGLRERFPIAMDKDIEVRELNTFDIYSPAYRNYHYCDEVYDWFKENEFCEIEPARYLLGMKGKKC